ncbi:MAG: alkylmercury lyase, partial [Candidatus Dormibacteria bacterium]
SPLKIELLHLPECPHVDEARQLLRACLSELDLTDVAVADREGNFPSPSILVNGIDVMGAPPLENASCRLDLPTRERVVSALHPEARATS